ncbi:S-layer homology domain-containing protein [Fusibacter bizertensis]|uniref:S-layer homology domain-containing protein n=1 Tax=Fusibacter bizertensis TaxID=1488331 RepID=A0ABT6NE75_9FIRM|nr:S-layer homology domain-containing protein [Fusibacter bizertensis]MDH8678729.1 S-layer homology domain-containing protein [Fusibacter bizertensis]
MKFSKFIGLFLTVMIIAGLSVVGFAESKTINDFKDIPESHWGKSFIEWGLTNNIMNGYSDGRFAPNDIIKESEFVAMLSNYATNIPKVFTPISGKDWSEPFYLEMNKLEMPFRGYDNVSIRNESLSRGQVAIIIAAKYGFALTSKQAVYFMYENGLSNGNSKTERTYDTFGVGDVLTRTQALAFLQNMDNLEDKVMTFKGVKSTKGDADATTILGMSGLYVNNKITVDFGDFNKSTVVVEGEKPDLAKVTSISTKMGADGKVVAVMTKLLTPVDYSAEIGRGFTKAKNYFQFSELEAMFADRSLTVYHIENSIVVYKGVELPYGCGFRGSDGMLTLNEEKIGIVQISLDYSGNDNGFAFKDKDAFIALMGNLKFLGATQGQINKAIEYVNKYHDVRGADNLAMEIVSKSTGKSIVVSYGKGDIKLALYNKTFGWKDFTDYVE